MAGQRVVTAVVNALNELGIPYMLTGSFASNFYGIPRATKDVDFVVQLAPGGLDALVAKMGADFKLNAQASFETITGSTRYQLHCIGTRFLIELFLPQDEPFQNARFSRRRKVTAYGTTVWISTAEDVIVQKLRWAKQGARPKDIQDAQDVLAAQFEALDWAYMRHWCAQHSTLETLERLRNVVQP